MLFEVVGTRANIKARIQALQSLLAYEEYGGTALLGKGVDTIVECLNYKTHFSGSTAELNYLDIFEDAFLDLWLKVSASVLQNKNDAEIQAYLNSQSTFSLLQSVTDYLRKELSVPQYSGTFSSESEFVEDTRRLFDESPGNRLHDKIAKVKCSLSSLLETIESAEDIRVSFSVFEGIKQLA